MVVASDPTLILVAGCDDNIATLLRHLFVRADYRVHVLSRDADVVTAARRLAPGLLVLGLQADDARALQTLRTLREHPLTGTMPLMVMLAHAPQPWHEPWRELGLTTDDFIVQPFSAKALLSRVRSRLQARQLEDALLQRTRELEALLRVAEELTQQLALDELHSVILYLALDMLPATSAMLVRPGEDALPSVTIEHKESLPRTLPSDHVTLSSLLRLDSPVRWCATDPPLVPGVPVGMAVPLEHGVTPLGTLMVARHDGHYSDDQLRLLQGIARQAALAIHNAELYDLQANYALHLEDMVTARTHELQRTQEMLFRTEKLASIGRLAASVAHEINNPLQPLMLHLEHLHAGGALDVEDVDVTVQSVQRIGRIVKQLLEFTRSSHATQWDLLDVRALLDAVVRLNTRVSAKQGVAVHTHYSARLPHVTGNRDQLEQVFMNLMLNALDAMPKGGTLHIEARAAKGHVVVSVRDSGTGIPQDVLPRVFEPFVTTKPSGSGLGLYVTHGIVETHNGKISVQSTPKAGSTFTVMLPAAKGAKAQ